MTWTDRRPWRAVVDEPRPIIKTGRGSVLGPDTSRRTRWWVLTLECDHTVERSARYVKRDDPRQRGLPRRRSDVLDPPRRCRCDACPKLAMIDVVDAARP